MKRILDIVASASGILLLSPVLICFAGWIKLSSPGPVFYRGVRVGRGGRPFKIFKFRSMVVDDGSLGATSTPEDDPRVTRVGTVMRKYKLDELAQLFNVLAGQMSLVGPRPQVEWAVELYGPDERHLLDVRPGITDYASLVYRNEGEMLKGSIDPDKDYLEKIAPGKILLGLEYVRRHTFLADIKIIAATLLAILGQDPIWCIPADLRWVANGGSGDLDAFAPGSGH